VGTWAIDLDGVIWWGEQTVPGAPEAIRDLLAAGEQVVFCTNHALSPEVKVEELTAHGIPPAPVVTSAEAAASCCTPSDSVLVMGAPSLHECLSGAGLRTIDVLALPDGAPVPPVDAVVVGATAEWDRSRVGMVADAIRAGARFLATNDDPTYPVVGAHGPRLLPGNGALVAAVATAAGRPAEVTGKPHRAMADLLVARHGTVDVVVGDKPETDGRLARELGTRFALVLSGVTGADEVPGDPCPWQVADSLVELVRRVLEPPGSAEGPRR
jgi:4-nitrophenyl phosphatase